MTVKLYSFHSIARVLTVPMKNQPLAYVSASKKNVAPAFDWPRKSAARVAIHLKMENPAPDLSTNKAMACCKTSPTMTVGLWESAVSQHGSMETNEVVGPTHQGMRCLFFELAQKPS